VSEAAVFGLPDPAWGTAVAAAIVPAPGTMPHPDRLAAALRSHIAGYKVPSRWTIVDDLPRNAAGKVDRGALTRRLRPDA
jgi:acyl-CoA synthetase (AMP-forming)/AMP-acid ligase II